MIIKFSNSVTTCSQGRVGLGQKAVMQLFICDLWDHTTTLTLHIHLFQAALERKIRSSHPPDGSPWSFFTHPFSGDGMTRRRKGRTAGKGTEGEESCYVLERGTGMFNSIQLAHQLLFCYMSSFNSLKASALQLKEVFLPLGWEANQLHCVVRQELHNRQIFAKGTVSQAGYTQWHTTAWLLL